MNKLIKHITFLRKMKRFEETKRIYLKTKDRWVKAGVISEEAANRVIQEELQHLAIKIFGTDKITEVV